MCDPTTVKLNFNTDIPRTLNCLASDGGDSPVTDDIEEFFDAFILRNAHF